MSIVAIEVNPNRILLVAGRKAANRPLEVSHAIEIPIKPDQSDAVIADKLKQVVDDLGLARSEATVVLSRSQSELREIDLPPVPDDELPDMVMFKAKSDFASFNERWLLDFVSLDGDETKPRRILASAIAPTVSEKVQAIIEPSGLKLKRMVLRPFSIMELLQSQTNDDLARLVVNPGDDFTDIVVSKGSQMVSTRSIRMSDAHSADQRSQQLVSEVRRTLASSKRQLGGAAVTGVILLDDEKANRHLVGNLQERLKIDVSVFDPFEGMKRIGQAKGDVASPWQYTPLLGSLVHQGNDIAPAIDFLNPSRRKEVIVDRSRYWLYGSLAGLAALLTIFFGWWTLSSQSAEITKLKQDLVDSIAVNEGDMNRPSVDETLGRTGMIDDWQKANVNWLEELHEVSGRFLTADEAIMSNWNASIRRNVPTIEISGKIASNEEDQNLFRSLEARPFVVTPTKADVSEGDAEYPYTFGESLAMMQTGNDWLKEIDEHAREFKKRREEATETESNQIESAEKGDDSTPVETPDTEGSAN